MKIFPFLLAGALAGLAHADDKDKPSSGTSNAPGAEGIDLAAAFKRADIDGDGQVSKAEAAGNERLVVGFDRADRNRDGQLSREEFDSIYKPRAEAKPKAKSKSAGSPKASTGR